MERCILLVDGRGGRGSPAPAADAALAAEFQAYLDQEFARRPLEATRQGDHRFDNMLDDVSPAARKDWPRHAQAALDRLARIKPADLSRSGQIDLEIFQHYLRYQLWLLENTHPFEQDPRVYNDYVSESVFLVLTQSTLPKHVNIRNAAARSEQIPKIVAAAKESLSHPPRAILETAIRQNRGSIAFYERGIFELVGESPQISELKTVAATAAAALKDYQEFLEKDLLPQADGDWRLGKEKFAQKLELELERRLDGRRGARRRRGRVRPRRARDVRRRPAAVGEVVPGQAAAARRRRRPAPRRFARCSTRSARTTASPKTCVTDAQQRSSKIKAFITQERHLCGCRSRTAARSSRCRSSSAATRWRT